MHKIIIHPHVPSGYVMPFWDLDYTQPKGEVYNMFSDEYSKCRLNRTPDRSWGTAYWSSASNETGCVKKFRTVSTCRGKVSRHVMSESSQISISHRLRLCAIIGWWSTCCQTFLWNLEFFCKLRPICCRSPMNWSPYPVSGRPTQPRFWICALQKTRCILSFGVECNFNWSHIYSYT